MRVHSCVLIWTTMSNASSLLSVNLDHYEQCEFTHSLTTASADICLGNELQALFELFQSLEREKKKSIFELLLFLLSFKY